MKFPIAWVRLIAVMTAVTIPLCFLCIWVGRLLTSRYGWPNETAEVLAGVALFVAIAIAARFGVLDIAKWR